MNSFIRAGFIFHSAQPKISCPSSESFSPCLEDQYCSLPPSELFKDPDASLDNWSFKMDLFCDRKYFITLINSAVFLGGILSSIFLSRAADLYGRRPIYWILLGVHLLSVILFLALIEPVTMTVVAFLFGFSMQTYTMIPMILAEYLDRKNYAVYVSLTNFLYPVTGFLTAGYYYLINNYEILFSGIVAMSVICNLLAWKYFFESPKWLLSMNLLEDYKKVLEKVARLNGMSEEYLKIAQESFGFASMDGNEVVKKGKKTVLIDILKRRSEQSKLLVFSIVWLSYGFMFQGLLLNTEKIDSPDRFFENSLTFFSGLFLGNLVSGYFCQNFGRLITLKIASFFGGLSLILFAYTPESFIKNLLLFIASVGLTAGFNVCYILTPESFASQLRTTVMGFLNLLMRLGSLCVPGLSLMMGRSTLPTVIGGIAFVAAGSAFCLKETIGREMEEGGGEKEITLIENKMGSKGEADI